MDMYFLFRSWKQSPKPCLSVYNAGGIHTSTLYEFLTTNNSYYTSYFGTGVRIDNDISKTTNFTHQLTSDLKSVVKGKQDKKIRCITIQKNIDLYNLIKSNLQTYSNGLKAFNDKETKMLTRFNVLGHELFKRMLEGYPITEQEYKDKLVEYNRLKDKNNPSLDINSLGLTSIKIFDEYKSKRTI